MNGPKHPSVEEGTVPWCRDECEGAPMWDTWSSPSVMAHIHHACWCCTAEVIGQRTYHCLACDVRGSWDDGSNDPFLETSPPASDLPIPSGISLAGNYPCFLRCGNIGRVTRAVAKHAAPKRAARAAGPVTVALRIARKREPRPVALALRMWPLLPALFLIIPVIRHHQLGHHAGLILGLDATLCLCACITVTPLMTIMRARAAKLRWWYGTWMFALGAAGLIITMGVGHSDAMGAAAGDSVNWTGLLIVVLLLPMAVTSNAIAQKALGPEWKRWQRWLLWTVWVIVAVHLAALQAWETLAAFTAMSVPGIITRRARGSIKAWRTGGYSTGGWWVILAILLTLWLSGLITLATELGVACARAA